MPTLPKRTGSFLAEEALFAALLCGLLPLPKVR